MGVPLRVHGMLLCFIIGVAASGKTPGLEIANNIATGNVAEVPDGVVENLPKPPGLEIANNTAAGDVAEVHSAVSTGTTAGITNVPENVADVHAMYKTGGAAGGVESSNGPKRGTRSKVVRMEEILRSAAKRSSSTGAPLEQKKIVMSV